ncbi:MAG: 4-hydroxy-tetrahydrodipicolinate reductase, partial [Firmicutes bacterium]|nr:4-hydroxy-tetrahydrodipicolinate reductase [Bacillota bacterium]
EIGISSVRGGAIVAEHEVLFCGPDEVITFKHSIGSKEVFANGALAAARFMAGVKEPGLYDMGNVIGKV